MNERRAGKVRQLVSRGVFFDEATARWRVFLNGYCGDY
ncbi:hypothetical protein BURPS668_A0182 [Burkholderia pseudomallei 668]|nr:hypothetical protein BURPS668_A0182 [Burkholderia pseudomallei 668]